MYPWRRILIPTDFSTAAEWAFDGAVALAGATGAELVILHIRITWPSDGELRFPADDSIYEYAEEVELEKLRERVRHANASISTRKIVRIASDPGAEICRVRCRQRHKRRRDPAQMQAPLRRRFAQVLPRQLHCPELAHLAVQRPPGFGQRRVSA